MEIPTEQQMLELQEVAKSLVASLRTDVDSEQWRRGIRTSDGKEYDLEFTNIGTMRCWAYIHYEPREDRELTEEDYECVEIPLNT